MTPLAKKLPMLIRRLTTWLVLFLSLSALFFANPIDLVGGESENLRVGYSLGAFRAINPKDAQIAIEIWVSQIGRQGGMQFNKSEAHLFNNLSELIQAINNQKIDIVGLGSIDYLRIKNQVQLEPVLVTDYGGDYGNEYILLAPKEFNIRNLSQLKGKKIFLHDRSAPIPLLWLRHLLKKHGLPGEDKFFSSYQEVSKASQAILPVFFRQADACIVSCRAFETASELNPQISQKLEAIITSPLYADCIFLFHKGYKSNNKKVFIDTAINLKKYPWGKQVMTLFQIDGFAPFKEAYLANVLTLMQESGKFEQYKKKNLKGNKF